MKNKKNKKNKKINCYIAYIDGWFVAYYKEFRYISGHLVKNPVICRSFGFRYLLHRLFDRGIDTNNIFIVEGKNIISLSYLNKYFDINEIVYEWIDRKGVK